MGAEGEFALVREHLEKALDKPGQPVKRGSMAHEHDVYAMLADAAARQRDAAALRKYAPRAEALAARDEHRLYLAMAQRAWGVAHRLAGPSGYAEAEARFNRALDTFRQAGMGWQAGCTLLEIGELARERGQAAAAREAYAQALAAFESLGAVPDAERTRTALQLV